MASGCVPVIKSAQNDSTFKDWLASANGYNGLSALCIEVALSQADSYYTTPAFSGSSVARRQVGYLMIDIFQAAEPILLSLSTKYSSVQ